MDQTLFFIIAIITTKQRFLFVYLGCQPREDRWGRICLVYRRVENRGGIQQVLTNSN